MEKKEKSFYNKFEIKKKGSIDENINKLQNELDIYLKGAEEIVEEDEILEKKDIKKPEKKVPFKKEASNEKYKESTYKPKDITANVNAKFNKKILFIPLFIFILFIGFIKFPLFKYTTTPKKDRDIPGIEIKTIFYYNVLGTKLKEKTILNVGNKEIIIPISIEKWFGLSKEEKIKYIKVFQSE